MLEIADKAINLHGRTVERKITIFKVFTNNDEKTTRQISNRQKILQAVSGNVKS